MKMRHFYWLKRQYLSWYLQLGNTFIYPNRSSYILFVNIFKHNIKINKVELQVEIGRKLHQAESCETHRQFQYFLP